MFLPWIRKLLLMLHSEILQTCPTHEQTPPERSTLYLGWCYSTSLWWNEETLYWKTCPYDARSDMTLSNRMWCIKICIWHSPYASYHRPSPWWNRITKFMITNFYPWSEPFKNGDIIFKDLHTKQQSIWTTRTSHISEVPRNSINNKPNGPCSYPNMTSNWSTF